MPESNDAWVLDASVIFNLLGCGIGAELLAALPGRALIADRVERELLYHPVKGLEIDASIRRWKSQHLLKTIAMGDSTLSRYFELVGQSPPEHLDDGEAASIAVAEDRNVGVVLDERRARRIVSERFTTLKLQSTAGLFRLAANTGALDRDTLAMALHQALVTSKMRVVPTELIAWVVAVIGRERAAQCHSLPKRYR